MTKLRIGACILGFLIGSPSVSGQESAILDEIEAMYAARLEKFQSAPTPSDMADAYVVDVAEDAVWMPQNEPPVRGKEAVHSYIGEFFNTYILEISSQLIESLDFSDTIAIRRFWTIGTYVERDGGRRIPFDQKYVDILKKLPDGSWKLAMHMWSSNNKDPSIWD